MKQRSGWLPLKALIFIIIFLFAAVSGPTVQAKTKDKIRLQEESAALLNQLNHLLLTVDDLNALFSDQSEANICGYAKRYSQVIALLDRLEVNLKDWKQLVKQNRNDKVYRAYVATLQLAMFSIYSQPHAYIGFLKVYTPDVKGVNCADLQRSPDMPAWDMKSSEWEIKAESYLVRVQESIEKALSLDPFYDDARILKAQFLVFQKDYDAAMQAFMELEADGVFGEKRSYLNSWMAYIATRRGDTDFAEEKLKRALAFSEPPENSNWASNLLRSKRLAQAHWMVFDHHDFEPPKDTDLTTLKTDTRQAIMRVRKALSSPLSAVSTNITEDTLKTLVAEAAHYPRLMITLESDQSDENLIRYATLIESLHASGAELVRLMKIWDELADTNPSISYYYRLQKSSCGLSLMQMIENAKPLLYNKKLIALLETRQKEREETVFNYLSEWQAWSDPLASLSEDIKTVQKMADGLLAADLLAFEYQAVFSDTVQAQQALDQLADRFRELKVKNLLVFSDSKKVDTDAYITVWQSYLASKSGALKSATDFLKKTEQTRGLSDWKTNQEKIIKLKTLQSEGG